MVDTTKKILLAMSLLLIRILYFSAEQSLPISEALLEQLHSHPGLEDIMNDGRITQEEADTITFLFLSSSTAKLSTVEDLPYFRNLTHLSIKDQNIKDITPLRELKHLEYLELDQNQIIDITPLTNLEHLDSISLSDNYIDFHEPSNKAWLEAKGITEAMLSSKPYIANLTITASTYTFSMFDFYVSARTSQKEISLSLETVLTDQVEVYLNDDKLSETVLGNFNLVLMQGNNRVELLLTNGYHTANYSITIYYEPPAITTRRPIITTTPSTTTIVEPSTGIPNTNNEIHAEEPIPPANNHTESIIPVIDIPLTSDTRQYIEPATITKHPDILNQTNIGLLQVEGAAINHDVFQSDDNAYFLKYNRNRIYDKQGELFLDYRHHDSSMVKVIYGHHMRDGSMFGKLIQYRYEEHMRKHPYAYLTYRNGTEQYEVIAAFFYDTTKDHFDYTTATTKEISTFLSERTRYQKVPVAETDQLLLLSTCNYDSFGNRFVVVLKKSEKAVHAKNSKIMKNTIV